MRRLYQLLPVSGRRLWWHEKVLLRSEFDDALQARRGQ